MRGSARDMPCHSGRGSVATECRNPVSTELCCRDTGAATTGVMIVVSGWQRCGVREIGGYWIPALGPPDKVRRPSAGMTRSVLFVICRILVYCATRRNKRVSCGSDGTKACRPTTAILTKRSQVYRRRCTIDRSDGILAERTQSHTRLRFGGTNPIAHAGCDFGRTNPSQSAPNDSGFGQTKPCTVVHRTPGIGVSRTCWRMTRILAERSQSSSGSPHAECLCFESVVLTEYDLAERSQTRPVVARMERSEFRGRGHRGESAVTSRRRPPQP
jgi:hypothetical protein